MGLSSPGQALLPVHPECVKPSVGTLAAVEGVSVGVDFLLFCDPVFPLVSHARVSPFSRFLPLLLPLSLLLLSPFFPLFLPFPVVFSGMLSVVHSKNINCVLGTLVQQAPALAQLPSH